MGAGLWSTLTERTRIRAFGLASLAAFGMSYWVGSTGEVLRTDVSPFGIVSLELAGTPEVAQRIYDAWGETGQVAAQFNIRIDFLYLVAYGLALSIGCAVARRWWQRRSALLARAGAALTWLMLVAALSDACENAMLWQMLHDPANALWAQLARGFALVKFALLGVGLLYIMLGAFSRIGQRRSGGRRTPG
jgi:hypothetical protein